MRARKLLVVSDEMEVGGSQRQITYLLGGLDRRQWQPELVFFRKESFLVRDLRAQGIVVHHVPKRGRLDPRFVLAYAALLRRERYDLVHAYRALPDELRSRARLVLAGNGETEQLRHLTADEPGIEVLPWINTADRGAGVSERGDRDRSHGAAITSTQ